MNHLPRPYVIGRAERTYLEKLEHYRRQKIPLSPVDFCRREKLAGTKSIRRYLVLKAELNAYGWATAPTRMRGLRPTGVMGYELAPDPRIAQLERRLEVLTEAERERDSLREELSIMQQHLLTARGALMAMVSHYSRKQPGRAKRFEAKLFKVARAVVNHPISSEDHNPVIDSSLDAILDDIQKSWGDDT